MGMDPALIAAMNADWASYQVWKAAQPVPATAGEVTVTDGTTTVSATSIELPAGTVTDGGSGVAELDVLTPD